MSDIVVIEALARESVGKGTARAIRRAQRVPAVIYGDKKPPVGVSVEERILIRYVNKAGFFNHLFDIELDGKKHRVLPRDVQFDPVSDRPLHVDFMRVSAASKIRVHVPVNFVDQDKSPGLKRGGALNIVAHEIEVSCSPSKIPEKFEVSMEGYEIGATITLDALTLPSGVTFTAHDKDRTIASIAVPSAIRSEALEAAAKSSEAAAATAAPAAGAAAAPAAAPAAAKK